MVGVKLCPGTKHGGPIRGAQQRLSDWRVVAFKGEAPVAIDAPRSDREDIARLALHALDGISPELRDVTDKDHVCSSIVIAGSICTRQGYILCVCKKASDAGDVEAAIDEGDLAGDAAGQRAGQEQSRVADFILLDVAV